MAEPKARIGDYVIEAELGAGGMATVYRARHVVLGSRVALKVLDPRFRTNATARRRFLDEARIQHSHLDHPNVVKVTGIVATDDHAALVMELIDGGSLEDELPRLRGRTDEIRAIMAGVLAGVGHAHAAGIIHRDLKPANVLLQRNGAEVIPKVTDFGIAKLSAELAGPGKKSTHGDSRMGTLNYMSPEQIKRAKDVTPRSDIFSLGAMLYELATGALPFDGENDYDVMDQIIHGRYVPPEEREPRVDPNLAAVIRQALAPDPERRFARCEAMAAALGSARPVSIDSGATLLMPVAPPEPPPPRRRDATPVPRRDATPVPRRDPTPAETQLLPIAPSSPPAWRPAGAPFATAAATVVTLPGTMKARGSIRGRRWWTSTFVAVGGAVVLLAIKLAARGADPGRPGHSPSAAGGAATRCPAPMIAIAGATFEMGSPPGVGTGGEQPRHRVTLSPYCLDRTEVTVRAYAACTGCGVARAAVDDACNSKRANRDDHPMNCVSWVEADAYCRSFGKRLPTEPEWELAAGGPGGRTFPWGEAPPSSTLLNMRGGDGYAETSSVGAFPRGATPDGVFDLAGNVYEWVADESAPYTAANVIDPPPVVTSSAPASKVYVMRGGSWKSGDVSDVRVARRAYFKGVVGGVATGFRCARAPL